MVQSVGRTAGPAPSAGYPERVALDVGCGKSKRPGSIGIDHLAVDGVDVVADFVGRLPFRENSVDRIYTYHTLEHTEDLVTTMEEFWRVCKPGALVYIRGPHASCPYTTWSDPTHRRGLLLETFRYFGEYHLYNFYTTARFKTVRARLLFTVTGHRAGQKWHRRLASGFLETLANANLDAQYRCERWWAHLVGIEEFYILLQAVK